MHLVAQDLDDLDRSQQTAATSIYIKMEQQPAFWKKRILVPFWILRICIMIFIIAAYAYTLRTLKDLKDVTEPAVG